MLKYFKIYKKLDLNKIAKNINIFWKKKKIFKKSFFLKKKKSNFIFYEGPPSANGKPGIHHILSQTIKDIFCRYNTLKGKKVERKGGWDTHGLPIELEIEKKMNLSKRDIEKKISIKKYNHECKISVLRYINYWKNLIEKIGYWIDIENPYLSYKSKYIETIWFLLKKFYKKGLLYKSYSVQPYSPIAGTGLSSHELNLPGAYKKVTDIAVTVQFKIKKNTLSKRFQYIKGNIFFLSWTTTPWTLPSNTALCIRTDINYVLIYTYNPYNFKKINVIIAEKLINKIFTINKFYKKKYFSNFKKKIPYTIIDFFKGYEINKSYYEQLIPWIIPKKNLGKIFKVIHGDFVNTENGTGIVHISPTFGIEDFIVAKKNNIESLLILNDKKKLVPLVDLEGKFLNITPEPFCNKYVKNEYYKNNIPNNSVDLEMALLLKRKKKLFKIEKYTHTYPHCWRTEKPIIYYPLNSWFIKTTKIKKKMIILNEKINWLPKKKKEKKFNYWIHNINDWNLSRSRYWGVPLPIWRTKDGKEEIIIGSIKELINEINKSIIVGFMKKNPFKNFIPENMDEKNYEKVDLHKHIIDKIILCSSSKKPMIRESDVIDVWFDSGSMPYAQIHYPFENKKLIDKKKNFPADFISEGIDQTRGWFFTLHVISCALFKSISYKNVLPIGLVLDKNGHKMSKSKGNSINPFKILKKYSPDVVRWYLVSNSFPWENIKFNINEIENIKKKFFNTLYNTYSFFSLYANIDHFNYLEKDIFIKNRSELDKWILSKINNLIKKVDKYYKNYNPTYVTRKISNFTIKNLSNWYIRLSRRIFWKEKYTQKKISAYQTLYICLFTIAKLASPIAPFYMDNLYQDLVSATKKKYIESVHLVNFPKYNSYFINNSLEKKMNLIQKITSLALSIRKEKKIKVRQPLKKIIILIEKNNKKNYFSNEMLKLIKKEVNIKNIIFLSSYDEYSNILLKKIKPNYKLIGPRLRLNIKKISKILFNLTEKDIYNFEKKGKYIFYIKKKKIYLYLNEVKIFTEGKKGWAISSDKGISVALDTKITKNLKEEGYIREIINIIQIMRKRKKLKIIDKIFLYIKTTQNIYSIIKKNKIFLCKETLSQKIFLKKINKEKNNNIYIKLK